MAKKVFGFRVDADDDFDEDDEKDSKKGTNEGFIRLFVKTRKISDGVHVAYITGLTKKGPAKKKIVEILADGEDIASVTLDDNGFGKSGEIRPTKDIVRYTFFSGGTDVVKGLTGPKPTIPPGASFNNWICLGCWLLSLGLLVASFIALISPAFDGKESENNVGEIHTPTYEEQQSPVSRGFALPLSLLGLSVLGFVASAIYTSKAFKEEIDYVKRTTKIKAEEAKIKAEGNKDKKEDEPPSSGLWNIGKKLLTSAWSKSFFGDILAEYLFRKK